MHFSPLITWTWLLMTRVNRGCYFKACLWTLFVPGLVLSSRDGTWSPSLVSMGLRRRGGRQKTRKRNAVWQMLTHTVRQNVRKAEGSNGQKEALSPECGRKGHPSSAVSEYNTAPHPQMFFSEHYSLAKMGISVKTINAIYLNVTKLCWVSTRNKRCMYYSEEHG